MIRFAVALLIPMSLSLIIASANGQTSSKTQKPDNTIAIGGVSGFNSLTNKAAIAKTLSTGRVGYYFHYTATNPKYFNLSSFAPTFAGRGDGIVEVSLGGGFNPAFFSNQWRRFEQAGFHPAAAAVNLDNSAKPFAQRWDKTAQFDAFVDAGRSVGGLSIFAPVVSPNSSGGRCGRVCDENTVAALHPWDDEYWNDVKAAAAYGGGVTLDTPPAFYFNGLPDPAQQAAYQKFIRSVVLWGAQKKLWVNFLVSPYFDNDKFLSDSQRLYNDLQSFDALPSNWTVLNYNECGPPYANPCVHGKDPAFGVPVGDEDTPNTIASVALWFAKHANVRKYTGPYAGVLAPK